MIYVKTRNDMVYEHGKNKNIIEYETPIYKNLELLEIENEEEEAESELLEIDHILKCFCNVPQEVVNNIISQSSLYKNVYLNREKKTKEEIEIIPAQLDEEENIIVEEQQILKTIEFWDYTVIFDTPKISLEDLKQIKNQELTEKCSEVIEGGFVSQNGRKYGTDLKHDQINFIQQMQLILDGDASDILWKNELTGEAELHTVQEFREVLMEFKDFKLLNQTKLWNLRQQLSIAQTEEELNLIVWE